MFWQCRWRLWTTRSADGKAKEDKKPDNNGDEHKVVSDEKAKQEKKADNVVVFINDKGVAKQVEVKTGISDYDNIEITSGLNDSSQVVTGPFLVVSKRLKEGDKIRQAVARPEDKDKTVKK